MKTDKGGEVVSAAQFICLVVITWGLVSPSTLIQGACGALVEILELFVYVNTAKINLPAWISEPMDAMTCWVMEILGAIAIGVVDSIHFIFTGIADLIDLYDAGIDESVALGREKFDMIEQDLFGKIRAPRISAEQRGEIRRRFEKANARLSARVSLSFAAAIQRFLLFEWTRVALSLLTVGAICLAACSVCGAVLVGVFPLSFILHAIEVI